MKLSEFDFELPQELIAKYPVENRDESRMMVVHRDTGLIEHKMFKDIVDYFEEGDVMVRNNTKVFPARLFGYKEKTGAKIEVFLLRELDKETYLWDVLVDPARKIRVGNKLFFGDDESLVAEVIDNTVSRGRTLRFLFDGDHDQLKDKIYELGETPIPEEMERDAEALDAERYQTLFASVEGAVAAPASGLHFSRNLLKRLELQGIDFADVTLHVGLGTFGDVEVEDLTKHKMDSEEAFVSQETADIVNKAKLNKKKVCVVGTTAMRAIESSISTEGTLKPFQGWTNRFIFPPFEFNIADAMITNFHTPKSTLLMVTSAFMAKDVRSSDAGHEMTMKVYQEAIKEKYRFFSYGDALLIL